MNSDLKIIKKYYGEKMMHLCRSLFSTLLEQEGYLSKLLLDNFAPTKFLYEDIINNNYEESFKNYIYNIAEMDEFKNIKINKTPHELFNEIGYDLYECHTEEDIQKFKKYYAHGEELCTFRGGRLNKCHVFFAVKKNIDEIKREDFEIPERQDKYGTSVISIQFTKGGTNTLSIKNRYNHKVVNPDATFSNNLENIVAGLTNSFEKEYGLNINQNEGNGFELKNYVKASDGKFYKYNYEINNIYYCPDNIIIDNFEVKQYPKEKYIILDYFVIDLVNKKVELYDKKVKDSFIDGLKNIDKINIINDKETGNKQIEIIIPNRDKIIIIIDKENKIIEYKNNNLIKIGDNFLCINQTLKNVQLDNLLYTGNSFLENNKMMESLELPKLIRTSIGFLSGNRILKHLKLPLLMQAGSNFLSGNEGLKELELPNLMQVKSCFLYQNEKLEKFEAPNLLEIGNDFLHYNFALLHLFLPKVTTIGNDFLHFNKSLSNLDLPKLKRIGDGCLTCNGSIKFLNLPEVTEIGSWFLQNNRALIHAKFPKLLNVGVDFLQFNNSLVDLEMPRLISARSNFLEYNRTLEKLYAPRIKDVGLFFLFDNEKITLESLNKKNFSPALLSSMVNLYNKEINSIKLSTLSITKQIKKIICLYKVRDIVLDGIHKNKN